MLKKRILSFVLGRVFRGIAEGDFIDESRLAGGERTKFLRQGRDAAENPALVAELGRLRYRQERYLVNQSRTELDMIYGKAALYVIDMIEKRLAHLKSQYEAEKAEKETVVEQY